MGQHARLVNGRLLLAGRRPWHEWPAADLLDVCEVLREDEYRFLVSLKADIRLPDLPDVDFTRIAVASRAGYGHITFVPPPAVVDDGTWGLEDESWSPPDDADEA